MQLPTFAVAFLLLAPAQGTVQLFTNLLNTKGQLAGNVVKAPSQIINTKGKLFRGLNPLGSNQASNQNKPKRKPTYKPPKGEYGPPKPQGSRPKPQYKRPKPQYKPPKPKNKRPKPKYKPRKPSYKPPKKPQYRPPKRGNKKPSYKPHRPTRPSYKPAQSSGGQRPTNGFKRPTAQLSVPATSQQNYNPGTLGTSTTNLQGGLTDVQVMQMVLEMHNMIHQIMETQSQNNPSVSAPFIYASPQSQNNPSVSAPFNYASPQSPNNPSTQALSSYGSSQSQNNPPTQALPSYGSSQSQNNPPTQALPSYGSPQSQKNPPISSVSNYASSQSHNNPPTPSLSNYVIKSNPPISTPSNYGSPQSQSTPSFSDFLVSSPQSPKNPSFQSPSNYGSPLTSSIGPQAQVLTNYKSPVILPMLENVQSSVPVTTSTLDQQRYTGPGGLLQRPSGQDSYGGPLAQVIQLKNNSPSGVTGHAFSQLLDSFDVSDNPSDGFYVAPGKQSIRINRDLLAQQIIDYLLKREKSNNFVASPRYNPDHQKGGQDYSADHQKGWQDYSEVLRKSDFLSLSDDKIVEREYVAQSDHDYTEETYDYNDYVEENYDAEKFLKIDTFYE